MHEILEELPTRPLSVDEMFQLMTPPRQNIGLVTPLLKTPDEKLVCCQVEYDGVVHGIAYTADGWECLPSEFSDVDAALHDERFASQIAETFLDEGTERTSAEAVSTCNPDELLESTEEAALPPGLHSKMCLRHRPLSPEDFEVLQRWPQIQDAVPMWGDRDAGIVAVLIIEPRIQADSSIVSLYYRPDIETWRILDSTQSTTFNAIADHLHKETGKKVAEYYDSVDPIVGPPESTTYDYVD
ncbi:hypothetical protein [Salinibaculum rarum]|uniref:hypothetical protein n=1 Tax=Salinibaculum rarum TaxID=3058903 RepID=UPI00265F22BD|nr:hypothetical protein [Salinibaculum sp. KK48]